MQLSIHSFVGAIAFLLFLASVVSIYFALGDQYFLPLLLVALANMVAVLLFVFLVTRGVLRPLRRIRETLKDVSKGNFENRVKLYSLQEMKEVGEVMNEMIEKIAKERDEV